MPVRVFALRLCVCWIFSISLLIFRINRAKGNVMPAVGEISLEGLPKTMPPASPT